jgi:hypothetical protein
MPGHSSNITPFTLDLMTNMDWANLSDDIIGTLFSNFFIVYFGQEFPQGGTSSNNIKVKFAKLGTDIISGSPLQLMPLIRRTIFVKF